jgi:hypothetical protein
MRPWRNGSRGSLKNCGLRASGFESQGAHQLRRRKPSYGLAAARSKREGPSGRLGSRPSVSARLTIRKLGGGLQPARDFSPASSRPPKAYGNGMCGINCPLTVPEDNFLVVPPINWSVVYVPVKASPVALSDTNIVVTFLAYNAPSASNKRLKY